MPRGLALSTLVAWILACSGPASTTGPDAEPPDEPAQDAPPTDGGEEGGEEPGSTNDCLTGLAGVLIHAPGQPSDGHQSHPGPVAMYIRPNRESRVVGRLERSGVKRPGGAPFCYWRQGQRCTGLTWAYDARAMLVYSVRDGWADVATGRGGDALNPAARCRLRGWVKLEAPMAVRTVEELLEDGRLTHTLGGWSGALYDAPGGASRDSGRRGEVNFVLKSTRTVSERLWLEVDLIESHCEEDKTPVASGWLPATDEQDRLQVWYYTDC